MVILYFYAISALESFHMNALSEFKPQSYLP